VRDKKINSWLAIAIVGVSLKLDQILNVHTVASERVKQRQNLIPP